MDQEPDAPDYTRKKQTFFLSAEFLITMLVQSGVFLVLGTTVMNRVEARVSALEAQQVTAERIARIEEKMSSMLNNQSDLKNEFKELKHTVEQSAK